MKKFIKFLGIVVFMTALFVNVSISANKSTGDVFLSTLVLKVDACVEIPGALLFGRCSFTGRCYFDIDRHECDPLA